MLQRINKVVEGRNWEESEMSIWQSLWSTKMELILKTLVNINNRPLNFQVHVGAKDEEDVGVLEMQHESSSQS